jgi:hypothetical protein
MMPRQMVSTTSKPCSLKVGILGKYSLLCAELMPSSLMSPFYICASAELGVMTAASMWPPSNAKPASWPPLKGIQPDLNPAACCRR